MLTGDAAYIKNLNRGLILEVINEKGFISRAELSKVTGLNKATISVQVAQLLEEELLIESSHEHTVVGRKPIMLSINEEAGYVLGIDVDADAIHYLVTDLSGKIISSERPELKTQDYQEVLQLLATNIDNYQREYSHKKYGLINVTIGIHGPVSNNEIINFVPKLQWHNKQLREDLAHLVSLPIRVVNNANLSASAEKVFVHADSDQLISIVLSSGIGSGLVIDGKIQTGHNGYSGEMGHMIIYPDGKPCKCGNLGCWELYASETSFYNTLSKKLNDPDMHLEKIKDRLNDLDPVIENHLNRFIKHISLGINNIINLYNPETLVINSELLNHANDAVEQIRANLNSNISIVPNITLSNLGRNSCVLGACAFGIQTFLSISKLTLKAD